MSNPTNQAALEQILCDLHDLGFHGKDLAHLEKLAEYVESYANQRAVEAVEKERLSWHEVVYQLHNQPEEDK